MKQYTYLIIGGGMTAAAALEGIRDVDAAGAIGLMSMETYTPYNRPPLSKQLWTGKKTIADIMRPPPDRVELHLGRTAQTLDLTSKQVTDDQGQIYTYEKLLLATGGTPRRLPFGSDHILYFRTLADYHRLRTLAEQHDQFAVIGGGFIGSELAAALTMQGKQVTLLVSEPGICQHIFPSDVVTFLTQYYRDKGVEVLTGERVTGLEGADERLTVLTQRGRRIAVNGVVAGLGIQPNVALAEAAGLTVDNGIVVNRALQTSQPDVYAAGDVANFHDGLLAINRRVEHEDNANRMGHAAGRAMAGAPVKYEDSPMFYSDLFELGYEAVGELDARLDTFADWQAPYQTGVIYYLAERRVRGVLLWNVWGQVDAARALIAAGQRVTPATLAGRIR